MPIIINIDVMLARRKMSSGELAQRIGISAANLSILKTGKPRLCVSPRLKPSARLWTASPATCWNTCPIRSDDTIKNGIGIAPVPFLSLASESD